MHGAEAESNPLLQVLGVPAFDRIRAAHVVPAIERLLKQADSALEQAVDDSVPADYDAMSRVLDVALERFGRAWSAVGHLNEVADSAEMRAAYNQCLPQVTEFFTRLGCDERLYRKYRQIAASNAAGLSPARRQALALALRDPFSAAPSCRARHGSASRRSSNGLRS